MTAIFGVVLAAAAAAPPTARESTIEAGRRIYRDGISPSGHPVRGVVQGDVAFTGVQASCASCHRRSGFGASEAGTVAPPLIGEFLYRPLVLGAENTGLQRREGPGTRPAYDDASLVRAIRDGVDPTGRAFDPLMPRFELSDADTLSLVAYLKSLSSAVSPGVDEVSIHLATVVTPEVDPSRRAALLGVLEAFVRDRNADSRLENERKARSGWEKKREYQSYRTLVLHVWDLTGATATWRAQLEERYRSEPVFAMLSGLSDGEWRPVHEFCEAHEIPSLFPITDLPVVSDTDYYTMYFSRGLTVEAEALATYLRDSLPSGRIVQVFRQQPSGAVPAAALRAMFDGDPQLTVVDHELSGPGPPVAAYWQAFLGRERPAALVLWLAEADLTGFGEPDAGLPATYLSASLLGGNDPGAVPVALRGHSRVLWPYTVPSAARSRTQRARVWLAARKLPLVDERVQTGAFFAAALASDALRELQGYFTRDYFVERIEHMVDNSVTTSVYPRVSLGPGIRYASKGCTILRIDDSGPPVALTEWIVP